jgi:uncharacterized membrane protein YkoI
MEMRKIRRRNIASPRQNLARIATPIALAFVVAAGGAGLSYYQTRRADPVVSSAVQKVDAEKEALPTNLDGLLPVTTIQGLALEAGDGSVVDVALENRSDMLIYAVTLQDGTKLGFNATSGNEVLLQDDETAVTPEPQEKQDSLPADLTISTTFEEARKLAQEAFPSGAISQIKLNSENDVVAYSVAFTDKAEVNINVANGSVIRVTTPTGASAEAAADETPFPVSPTSDSSASVPGPSENDKQPSTASESDDLDTKPDDSENPTKSDVRVDGILTMADGVYTITEKDKTYVIETDQDMSGLIDKTVRVEGKLQSDNTVHAVTVQPRR